MCVCVEGGGSTARGVAAEHSGQVGAECSLPVTRLGLLGSDVCVGAPWQGRLWPHAHELLDY